MALRALLKREEPAPQTIAIVHGQSVFAVRINFNRRARRYTLRIDAAGRGVVLTVPPRGNIRDGKAFAERHGAWIAARLCRLPEPEPFCDGIILPLRGMPHRIVHRSGMRGTVWAELGGDGERLLCVAGQAPHMARRVADFLKREARRDLEAASARAAAMLGIGIVRISIRDQVSRWGSCSATGLLSYSWRLILAPANVLNYLAAHEVAHLVEMNHSREFWRLVERIDPDYARAKTWLTANGADLHRYGARAAASAAEQAAS